MQFLVIFALALASACFSLGHAFSIRQGLSNANTGAPQALTRQNFAPKLTRASTPSVISSVLRASHVLNGESISGDLKPLGSYVLLQKKREINASKGGVLLPVDSRELQVLGRVLKTGDGEIKQDTGELLPPSVREGDYVIFRKDSGEQVKYDDEECMLLRNEDLLAKVESDENPQPAQIQPLADAVLVRVLKHADKSQGGLFLTTASKQKEHVRAEVVAVGPGRRDDQLRPHPPPVKVGDSVIFSSYSQEPVELSLNKEIYSFVRGDDIIAKW